MVATNILEPLLDSLRRVAFLPTAVIEVWDGWDEVSNSINGTVANHGNKSFGPTTQNNRIESIGNIVSL